MCYSLNMSELKVSGYRGIWGESLTQEIAIRYAKAFGLFTKEKSTKENPKILIGRDGRESGPIIAEAIIPILKDMGIEVIYGDILSTPTMMFSVKHQKFDGGIIITASHNPRKYNGLKFITKEARMINEEDVEKIKNHLTDQNQENFGHTKIVEAEKIHIDFIQNHIDFILKNIDVEKIRARKFKVGVDMINASACMIDPYFFEKLGVEFIAINDKPNGDFAHEPEPLKENLSDLEKLVRENNCDLGFAQDPDADRLVIINENGDCISEEYTLAFGIENILSKNPGQAIAINMSTSQINIDIAEKYGSKYLRTKVGESHVFAGMKKINAIAGGEGGGGVIYPALNNCRDSFVSMALVLELLAEREQTVKELVNSLPKYFMKKDKENIAGKNLDEMYKKLKNHFKDTEINEEDGLRIDLSDKSWIHLRPSNTEPLIRLFGEAKTKERIEELFIETKNILM